MSDDSLSDVTEPAPESEPTSVPESSPESKPPEEKKDEPPARALDRVTLEVYCSASGVKWDQIAGFKAWAKRQKLARLTMTEWKVKHNEFVVRPVR